MENRTNKHFEITLPESIVVRNLGQARDSASLSAKLYLEEARNTDDPTRSENLEALAIERAIVADQLQEIARDQFGVEVDQPNGREENTSHSCSIIENEQKLRSVCEKLYRRSNDTKLKRYLRELRTGLLGLAASYEVCRTPAVAASTSM